MKTATSLGSRPGSGISALLGSGLHIPVLRLRRSCDGQRLATRADDAEGRSVDVIGDDTWRIADQDQTITRLGENLARTGALGEAPMARTLPARPFWNGGHVLRRFLNRRPASSLAATPFPIWSREGVLIPDRRALRAVA